MIEIRQELADSNTGWDFRQVMNLIYKKTGVRYHEAYLSFVTQLGIQIQGIKEKVCKYCFT
ncbi:MAG: hypothetical protein MRJ93_03250 [Nitrososphaeraceae archaeon]|nr:hypothetical protein [Nitrososphaeraceae archaeon]